ncbi:fasciclin-like arabinogalactan protein 11 [Juglans microcarpa x Juglans regia]|uniref:fasciclin-like arabinogalactan protein 11 n=1 Tax=Juglans microcarpa x Juglans regia TaxID=2249226 RepID=UPI001B7EF1B7|nr:fasciclin-like arabinogalactan protein 11 [Juglans microcarpa x Juglans regia]
MWILTNNTTCNNKTSLATHYYIQLRSIFMMKQVLFFPFLLFLVFLILHCTTSSAQSPAESPAPSGPVDIIAILKKAGHFATFIRLLRNTDMGEQLNGQLKKSNLGRTLFVPTDSSFSSLKLGTLNALTDKQELQLVQFHILPDFYSELQLQTATNPVHTLAGDSNAGHFQLNVTAATGKEVNITTGAVSTTVEKTIYTDEHLAVYQVGEVLLPLEIFGAAASPTASKPEKKRPSTEDAATTSESSGAFGPNRQAMTAISSVVGSLFSFLL